MKIWKSATIAAAVAVCAALRPGVAADDGAVSPDAARGTLAKWVETQQLIAKERKDWSEGKEILSSRIDVLKAEIAALRTKLKEARDSAFEANSKKSEAVGESQTLQHTGERLAGWVSELEAGLRTLEAQLPDPLLEKVKPLYDRIPTDAATTRVSLAERFQNVAGILNEVNKFNNEITMITEVRTLSGGKPAEVRTVYVGLAQAYFVSPGGEAGIGRPGAHGWEWTPRNAIAAEVAQTVEVLQAKAKPRFVPLPVKVQ